MRFLEIGCGTGRNLPQLLKTKGQVYAVDCDFDAVSTAHSLVEGNIFFSVARAELLPFGNAAFDEIHCIDVLHWSSDALQFESMWNDSWRVLRPEGIFQARMRCAQSARVSVQGAVQWFLPDLPLLEGLAAKSNAEWVQACEIKPGSDAVDEATMILRKK